MTRFARAKGSKSSNERLPEQATSWAEMKQQLAQQNEEMEYKKKQKQANEERQANYKAFLDEKEENEMKETKWADFPGVTKAKAKLQKSKKPKIVSLEDNNNANVTKHSENDEHESDDENESDDEMFNDLKSKIDRVLDDMNVENGDSDDAPEEVSAKTEVKEIKVKKAKKQVKKEALKIVVEEKDVTKNVQSKNKRPAQNDDTTNNEPQSPAKKKVKKNKGKDTSKPVKEKVVKENLTEAELKKIEKKKQKRIKQVEKKKRMKAELKKQKELGENSNVNNGDTNKEEIATKEPVHNKDESSNNKNKFQGANNTNINKFQSTDNKQHQKPAKVRDQKEHGRKKPFLPTKMIINGKEVEVDYVDGFPVKKADAVRLKKLRKEMISKGIPRSQINISLKLERRKAEKAFAREKKNVCFNCRKSGHNLSDCPELNKDQLTQNAGTGICFKCGSTEHTHFECKVVRGQDFKFATCFICNEQGHISRQCPDNARGLYPKGGACKVCGDVTHLKKDCPKYQAQQEREQNNINLGTIGEDNPDVLDGVGGSNNVGNKGFGARRQNKIVKF